jgi:hypothetical protein
VNSEKRPAILAIEDDETIKRHIKRLAEHNGWEALVAHRSGVDGHRHAWRDRWLRVRAANSHSRERKIERLSRADYRGYCARLSGGSRTVPGSRHGRLFEQAIHDAAI